MLSRWSAYAVKILSRHEPVKWRSGSERTERRVASFLNHEWRQCPGWVTALFLDATRSSHMHSTKPVDDQ